MFINIEEKSCITIKLHAKIKKKKKKDGIGKFTPEL